MSMSFLKTSQFLQSVTWSPHKLLFSSFISFYYSNYYFTLIRMNTSRATTTKGISSLLFDADPAIVAQQSKQQPYISKKSTLNNHLFLFISDSMLLWLEAEWAAEFLLIRFATRTNESWCWNEGIFCLRLMPWILLAHMLISPRKPVRRR